MEPFEVGSFFVRLAQTEEDRRLVQDLVDDVFHREEGVDPETVQQRQHDIHVINPACDHLMVFSKDTDQLIATYRLIRREHADKIGGFYTKEEYDLTNILNYGGEILEFSRAVTHKDFRTSGVMMIVWKGLAEYIKVYDVKLMFGIPSFHGTDPKKFAAELSYLYHFHRAPDEILCRSKDYTSMDFIPKDQINEKEAFMNLPPLLKGYLRVGAVIGDGAYVDEDFDTVDVQVIVETSKTSGTYKKHFLD
ncbi:MAG: GNAT family N-acetyltransferase [Alphaproteobacteria bacterium]|nr:GNAT family N-acetyltransferase [Alphaproteobacteria bacterium]MBN2779492.1 GNAT family N-acetyltransferase [Alphaproteobacteria bacterium]